VLVFNNNENRIGIFSGLVALILVIALTAMAFNALDPPRREAINWTIAVPEAAEPTVPSFGS
jgi:hypothetical protein